MNCERAAELLPWLANGTLEDDEARELREHVDGCAACRAERDDTRGAARLFSSHVPADALVAYAFDRPISGVSRDVLERHIRWCDSCREELGLVRESRASQPPMDVMPPSAVASRPAVRVPAWMYGAVAASLTLAATFGAWALWNSRNTSSLEQRVAALEEQNRTIASENQRLQGVQSQQSGDVTQLKDQLARFERPQLNAVVVDLFPETLIVRSDREKVNTLRIPADASVTLILTSQSADRFAAYDVSIVDAQQRAVWTGRGLKRGPAGDYTIALPAGFLQAGRYRIEVFGAGGDRRLVDRYTVGVSLVPPKP